MAEARKTRPVSWIKAALRDFEDFPGGARTICFAALTIAAEGGKADIAKPMQGIEPGVFQIALPFRGDAYRVVYSAARPRHLGGACLQEEIDKRHQNAEARD